MSTRGLMGIKRNGELKSQYNHFDSYISGLGKDIIGVITKIPKKERLNVLKDTFENIVLLNEEDKPTEEIIKYCIDNNLTDMNVGSKSFDDLYCLLRKTQGDLDLYIKGCKYMINGNDFLEDNIWCEYAYIINLDTSCLDIYTFGALTFSIDLLELTYKKVEDYFKEDEE